MSENMKHLRLSAFGAPAERQDAEMARNSLHYSSTGPRRRCNGPFLLPCAISRVESLSVTVKGQRERSHRQTAPPYCYPLVRCQHFYIYFLDFFLTFPSFFNKENSTPLITPPESTLSTSYQAFNYFSQALDCNTMWSKAAAASDLQTHGCHIQHQPSKPQPHAQENLNTHIQDTGQLGYSERQHVREWPGIASTHGHTCF